MRRNAWGITVKAKQRLLSGYSETKKTLGLYSAMQNINRTAINYIAGTMKAGMKLSDIKALLLFPFRAKTIRRRIDHTRK